MKHSVRATSDLHLFTFISYLQQSRVEDSFPLSSFGLLAIAAITSLFSMIEVGVKCVVDLGLPRKKAVVSVCFAGFLVGCFSCWSLVNIDNQDWVWGIGLLISGAFIAILAWKYGVEKLRTQEVNAKGADVHLPRAYYTGCMYLIPVLVVIMVVYWLLQTKNGSRIPG